MIGCVRYTTGEVVELDLTEETAAVSVEHHPWLHFFLYPDPEALKVGP